MRTLLHKVRRWLPAAAAAVAGLAILATAPLWWPHVDGWATTLTSRGEQVETEELNSLPSESEHEHAGHDHAGHEAGHDEATSLELSPQAMRNLGLDDAALRPVELTTFSRSIVLPATIVDRPGRTHRQVSAPLTGVVTRVEAVEGEALRPGDLILRMRVTHEDLVDSQTEFLKTLGELEVEEKEIERLRQVTRSGAVAGKVLLERQYERDKLDAIREAQRQALLLHGLDSEQIDRIASTRELLRTLQVFVPEPGEDSSESFRLADRGQIPVSLQAATEEGRELAKGGSAAPLTLERLLVESGQAVETGAPLCVLANLSSLYIEAHAFEQDIPALTEAIERGSTVEAIFDRPDGRTVTVENLRVRQLGNQIDTETRTLSVFVELSNEIVRSTNSNGHRFVDWRYRPGQRLQLRVPVEQWEQRIVLPVEAIAREGAENFVFVQNGEHFDRVPVLVEYRDQFEAVVASDGTLFPGDVVARRGAHQMQMALKNKSGGGVDPHAGHNH